MLRYATVLSPDARMDELLSPLLFPGCVSMIPCAVFLRTDQDEPANVASGARCFTCHLVGHLVSRRGTIGRFVEQRVSGLRA